MTLDSKPVTEAFYYTCFNEDCEEDLAIVLTYEGDGNWFVPDVLCIKCSHAMTSDQMKFLSAAMNYKHSQRKQ